MQSREETSERPTNQERGCGRETAQGGTRKQPLRGQVESWGDQETGVRKMPQTSWPGPPCLLCFHGLCPWPPQPLPCSSEPSLPCSSGTATGWVPKTYRLWGLGARLEVLVVGLGDALRLADQAQGALGSLEKDPEQKA